MIQFVPSTPQALRHVLDQVIVCDVQELQELIGHVVVSTAQMVQNSTVLGPRECSVYDPQTRTMVLMADRIRAGQEAKQVAHEFVRHHGAAHAERFLGDGTVPPSALPLVSLPYLFHVGSFDEKQKGQTHNRTSHEGNGLSVSVHPQQWRKIARLGDAPRWLLCASPERSLFVAAHELDAMQRCIVAQWAIDQGYIAPVKTIEVSWIDAEDDARRFFTYDAMDLAQRMDAQETFESLDETEEAEISTQSGYAATAAMHERLGYKVDMQLVESLALTLYAEDVLYPQCGVQGVWWNDDFDPAAFSAPRGVIHRSALPEWSRTLSNDFDQRCAQPSPSEDSDAHLRNAPG